MSLNCENIYVFNNYKYSWTTSAITSLIDTVWNPLQIYYSHRIFFQISIYIDLHDHLNESEKDSWDEWIVSLHIMSKHCGSRLIYKANIVVFTLWVSIFLMKLDNNYHMTMLLPVTWPPTALVDHISGRLSGQENRYNCVTSTFMYKYRSSIKTVRVWNLLILQKAILGFFLRINLAVYFATRKLLDHETRM